MHEVVGVLDPRFGEQVHEVGHRQEPFELVVSGNDDRHEAIAALVEPTRSPRARPPVSHPAQDVATVDSSDQRELVQRRHHVKVVDLDEATRCLPSAGERGHRTDEAVDSRCERHLVGGTRDRLSVGIAVEEKVSAACLIGELARPVPVVGTTSAQRGDADRHPAGCLARERLERRGAGALDDDMCGAEEGCEFSRIHRDAVLRVIEKEVERPVRWTLRLAGHGRKGDVGAPPREEATGVPAGGASSDLDDPQVIDRSAQSSSRSNITLVRSYERSPADW